ncbi:MAG: hypothetical protein R3B90_14605 [Planctomycetaceae bacterium]
MLTVIKVGGSLLELPDLTARLTEVAQLRASRRLLWLAGGGRLADVVRDWHRLRPLSEADAHDIAMETLEATAVLLCRLLPGGRLCRTSNDLEAAWSGCAAGPADGSLVRRTPAVVRGGPSASSRTIVAGHV